MGWIWLASGSEQLRGFSSEGAEEVLVQHGGKAWPISVQRTNLPSGGRIVTVYFQYICSALSMDLRNL